MASILKHNFSITFDGFVWNMIASPQQHILVFEIRNEAERKVRFFAYRYDIKEFLWREQVIEKSWWISLLTIVNDVLLLQVYNDIQNPGKQSLVAINLLNASVLWRKDDFHFNKIYKGMIFGVSSEDPEKELILDPQAGLEAKANSEIVHGDDKISGILQPFQYIEGTEYFDTVKDFLRDQLSISAIHGIEYLEYEGLIFISYYLAGKTGLANYLLVLENDSTILLNAEIDNNLKGLGVHTFFVLAGCLFFVKNKKDFLSYLII